MTELKLLGAAVALHIAAVIALLVSIMIPATLNVIGAMVLGVIATAIWVAWARSARSDWQYAQPVIQPRSTNTSTRQIEPIRLTKET